MMDLVEDVLKKGKKVNDLESLKEFLQYAVSVFFEECNCSVYLHGSRAKGCNRPTSDIDVVIFVDSVSRADVMFARSIIEEALEESGLPYRVDLAVFVNGEGDSEFVKRVIEKGARWL